MESITVTNLLGMIDDPRHRDRRQVYVDVEWGDARKHRQVLTTTDGVTVCLQLPRGTFLEDGAVLHDDGATVIVVRRPDQAAITATFADNDSADGARRMLLLGYLLGNQHAPLDVTTDRVATPLMTSPDAARSVLESLHIHGSVTSTKLAGHGWSNTSADHHHGHSHDGDHHDHEHPHD